MEEESNSIGPVCCSFQIENGSRLSTRKKSMYYTKKDGEQFYQVIRSSDGEEVARWTFTMGTVQGSSIIDESLEQWERRVLSILGHDVARDLILLSSSAS